VVAGDETKRAATGPIPLSPPNAASEPVSLLGFSYHGAAVRH
jgi:hypothetical protein